MTREEIANQKRENEKNLMDTIMRESAQDLFGKPIMSKNCCLWALLFSMLFWLAIAFVLWGIL